MEGVCFFGEGIQGTYPLNEKLVIRTLVGVCATLAGVSVCYIGWCECVLHWLV